jgi:hypothetical protein
MPLAYYSRAATEEFWSEHWGGHDVRELLAVARRSPLTALIESSLPPGGLEADAARAVRHPAPSAGIAISADWA